MRWGFIYLRLTALDILLPTTNLRDNVLIDPKGTQLAR